MSLFIEVYQMANRLMVQDFIYDGVSYNMRELNWKFSFNNNKMRLGLCRHKINGTFKSLYLSKWLIQNSKEPLSTWKNTMLHEIAHAIDWERRGRSDHSWTWKHIAKQIGCNANRTTKVDIDTDMVITKYTLICDTCGKKTPSHKIKRRKSSCGQCGNGRYNEDLVLRQVQNY